MDQRLLEVADVLLHVLAVAAQVEDRVTDELAGAVKGGLAAAVRLDDLDLGVGRHVQLTVVGPSSERDDGRMLQEKDRVGDRSL